MTEGDGSRRQPRGPAAPLLILLLGLAGATLLPASLLAPASAASTEADGMRSVIGGLAPGSLVLVDLDADLGTYPEIRYATRAVLADLLAARARLAVVSFSPEGRAVATAEIARLRGQGARPDQLEDLGFRTGAEAGLVQLAGGRIGERSGPVSDAVQRRGRGLAGFDIALVIGGGEIGPRSWVEQVQPRVPTLKIAAITPTFLLPEVQPYRDAGQLVALLGTLPDDVAYGSRIATAGTGGAAAFSERPPSQAALILGMLAAIGVLLVSSAGTLARWVRGNAPNRP